MFYDFGGAVLSGFLAADTEMTPMWVFKQNFLIEKSRSSLRN